MFWAEILDILGRCVGLDNAGGGIMSEKSGIVTVVDEDDDVC